MASVLNVQQYNYLSAQDTYFAFQRTDDAKTAVWLVIGHEEIPHSLHFGTSNRLDQLIQNVREAVLQQMPNLTILNTTPIYQLPGIYSEEVQIDMD